MRSEQTFNLFQSAREIKVAIVADGDRVGGLLNEQHPVLVGEGEPAFDYRQHMEQLTRQLDSTIEGAATAEDEHSNQQIRIVRARGERDKISARGLEKLLSARQGLESLYESGGFELAFLSGVTPREPKRLCEQLEQSAKLLERPAVERRAPKVKGLSIDPDEMAADLKSEWTALIDSLDRVAAAKKEGEGTLLAKREAIGALSRTVLWVGRTVEGLFHLAGEDELAQRIRTSTRRTGSPSDSDSQASDSDSQASDSQVSDSDSQASDSQASDSQASDSQTP